MILVAGALLAAGIGASLLAGRLRVPGLVLFLALGVAIGSEGTGWIDFGDYELARTIGVIALALILFEGGLSSGFAEIRPVLRPAISLAFLGTILTALITGLAAAWLLDFSLLEGLLLGSILAATDGAAIFALLRGSTLRRKLARTLEAESGLNDPVAILLVLGLIDWIQQPGYGIADMAWLFCRQLGIGLAVGRGRRRGGGVDVQAGQPGQRGPLPGGLGRGRRPRLRRGGDPRRLGLSRPSTWPGWRWAAPTFRRSARSPPFTTDSRGWHRSPSS